MRTPLTLHTNGAVFVLFFGVATLEAFQSHNWIKTVFWVLIALVFLAADNPRQRVKGEDQ